MKQLPTTLLMHVFLLFVGFSTIVANPVPVSLSNGEPSSDVIDTATTNELGKSEPPLSSQDSVAYAGNEDGTIDNTIDQGNTLIAPENQGSEPGNTSAHIGVGDEGDRSNSQQEQSVTSNIDSDTRGQESSNTAPIDIVNPDNPAGSQDLVALANQNVLNNNEASEGKGCVPAGASESKILKSRDNSAPCDGQIAQVTFPIEILPQFLKPFIEVPQIPAIGAPGNRKPTESPQKKPYPKPTTPWPRPNSPIRTPVDQSTCGPAEEGWLTFCCQGILKWAAPNGVSNVFSSMYPNLAITARNDVDACINYKEDDSMHRCDHDGAVTCCKRKEQYPPGRNPDDRILNDEFKGVDCRQAFKGAPDWPGKFKPKKRPGTTPPIIPPKTPKPREPPKRYDPNDYP